MEKFGRKVVALRIPILLLGLALLVPSFFGYVSTRVNYDILSYLPKDIETMVGQDILVDEFGTGAFSMFVVEGMGPRDVQKLKREVEQVEHVAKVLWYDSVMDISVPMELMPDELYEAFNSKDATMMAIIFDETTSADGTMEAIEEIRRRADKNCFLSGMSAVVTDTKNLSEKEAPVYVCIAVLLSCLVLQLGVTMDYSIFLWHSYKEKQSQMPDKREAMAKAIGETITSVVSSSLTTVAGFIALCFMSFTLGMDLGVVMAKGVVIGVIACITILPSMILVFDRALEKTSHRALLPDFKGIGDFVTKHYLVFVALFAVLLFPALYGYKNTRVYYNLDETLPRNLPSIIANDKLNERFDMNATHMLLLPADLPAREVKYMTDEMKKVDGVNWILGMNTVKGSAIPDEMIPAQLTEPLMNDNWQLLLVGSQYKVASQEVNRQCEKLSLICKSVDDRGMLVGEAPCTKDLIEITDKDFNTVSVVSIGVIFIIIMLVFKSVSLPVVLVSVIEMAIFVNMGIPYYTKTAIPFIASVVIGTIQLGATVDYAILMTTRYRRERYGGTPKSEAVSIACQSSVKSIVVSALSFFAATFGVGLFSNIDMISSLCTLMARGALISMVSVIFVLPSAFMVFDRIIIRGGMRDKKKENEVRQEAVSL